MTATEAAITETHGSTSPFLHNTKIQYAWDSTSLGWYKTCPRLYQYNMIEAWRPKADTVHLKFGILYHTGLESYDKHKAEGVDHDTALYYVVREALVATWDYTENKPWESDHPTKNRENLIRSIIWYIEHFIRDPAETVILHNRLPAVELSFKMELEEQATEGQPYLLCGHLDRIVDFAGGTYVMDRKTTGATIGSYYFDQYDPDNQMSLYTLAAQIIFKTPARGVIIDAAQIAAGFTRFARGFTYRTEAQTKEWLYETKHWMGEARGAAERDYWPRNDKSCHHYGGCTYRKVCSKSPEVRDKFLQSDYEHRPWNPLGAR